MRMREQYDRYSAVSILLHWLIAALVVSNLFVAEAMEDSRALFTVHKSIGITVLLLTLVRIGWRIAHPWPPFPEHMASWERFLARANHVAFYLLLLAVPLLGWATVSAGGRPFGALFGVIPWFNLPIAESRELRGTLGDFHEFGVLCVLILVGLHVAGAIKHHFLDRDVVLARMLPLVRRPRD